MTEVDDPNMASAFDLSLKKKKKKKTTKTDDKVEEAADEIEKLEVSEKPSKKETKKEEKDEDAEDGDADPSLDLSGKKKKKKKVTIDPVPQDEPEAGSDEEESSNSTSAASGDGKLPWDGSDRDYSYEELASRIYDLLHNNNPELGSKQKRYVMKPPQVCREGTKRTVWINFTEMSQIMKRKPEHVLNYVLAELGTNGSVDGSHRLVIKGRFQPKQIENVIRHYIAEYVACRTCKSPDTILKKDNRLYFLCCEACGSTRSVATIKKGYEAQIGKRKKEMT